MARPPATLLDELVEEILLRFPPDEPASLFRASLVCKPWCRLISGPRFRRRYREFHRTPPVLGFLCGGRLASDCGQITRFVPTSAFCSPLAERRCHLLDARHGRVLLLLRTGVPGRKIVLLVWDPITDGQSEIPFPKLMPSPRGWKAAVVCPAAAGGACDHLDCHRGAFLVVLPVVLRSTEDGWLGLATIHESKLYTWTWSRKHGHEADAVWTRDRVIELETLLCSNAILTQPVLLGFVERASVIFLREDDAFFTVDLKTSKVKKVWDGDRNIHAVVPYMSFYTPALGGGLRGEGPSTGVSSNGKLHDTYGGTSTTLLALVGLVLASRLSLS